MILIIRKPSAVQALASYATSFTGTENPISESSSWSQFGTGFTPMRTLNGRARGTNGALDIYDDSAARLTAWTGGNNYRIGAHIFRNPSINEAANHELEIHGRTLVDGSGNTTSYEILYNHLGGMSILSWSGTGGNALFFTELAPYSGSPVIPVTGTFFEVEFIGNSIEVFVNGNSMFGTTSSLHTTGKPGMGAFLRPGSNADDYCFEDWRVDEK